MERRTKEALERAEALEVELGEERRRGEARESDWRRKLAEAEVELSETTEREAEMGRLLEEVRGGM